MRGCDCSASGGPTTAVAHPHPTNHVSSGTIKAQVVVAAIGVGDHCFWLGGSCEQRFALSDRNDPVGVAMQNQKRRVHSVNQVDAVIALIPHQLGIRLLPRLRWCAVYAAAARIGHGSETIATQRQLFQPWASCQ
jgi:hypothetical protein